MSAHQDFKERNGLVPAPEVFDDERSEYFSRIMTLKDAPNISVEQMAERNRRSSQIARDRSARGSEVSA